MKQGASLATEVEHRDERKGHTSEEQVRCQQRILVHQGNHQGHRIHHLALDQHPHQHLARDQHQRRPHGTTLADMAAVAVAMVVEIQDIWDIICHIRTPRLPNLMPRPTSRHILYSRRSSIIVDGMIPLSR